MRGKEKWQKVARCEKSRKKGRTDGGERRGEKMRRNGEEGV